MVLGIDLEECLKGPALCNFVEFGICRKELLENDDIPRLITNRQRFPIHYQLMGRSITLTLRSLTLYIYGAPILDVSRSHTTTQHSR